MNAKANTFEQLHKCLTSAQGALIFCMVTKIVTTVSKTEDASSVIGMEIQLNSKKIIQGNKSNQITSWRYYF